VRFGGIENYDEVAEVFRALPLHPSGDPYIAGIEGLEYLPGKPPSVILDLDHYGQIIVRSNHITEL